MSFKTTANDLAAERHTRLSTLRRCHDCKRLTHNYRCMRCWAKVQGIHPDKLDMSVTPFDEVVG